MIIYLDMDGVMTNFVGSFLKSQGSSLTHDDIRTWDMHEVMGMTEQEMWERINEQGEGFWSDMEKYPWADQLFHELASQHEVIYLTSPGKSPHACSGKLKWIQNNHGDTDQWIFTNRKDMCARKDAVLIDDSDRQCMRFRKAGGKAILFPQPWNGAALHVDDRIGTVIGQL